MLTILLLPMLTAASPAVSTAGTGCVRVLTGSWTGGGTSPFGANMRVEARATYRADHSFVSTSRFSGPGQPVQDTTVSGRWEAKAGRRPGTCTIDMASKSAAGSSSSSSDVQIVDQNTYRVFGLDMRRVRGR